MARKNTFQLVEENYDIQEEIRKINRLFAKEYYLVQGEDNYITLKRVVKECLFADWKYRGTCVDIDEYFKRAQATISDYSRNKESTIINNLEVMENFLKLLFDNEEKLKASYGIGFYAELESVFCEIINTLEKRMGLVTREYKDKIILYPKNAPLEKIVAIIEDEDVQWEMIRYVREDLPLTEKRKTLAYLATNLYIEEDKAEQDEHIKELIKKACNILNNLHIRHNNKTGKWENKALKDLDKADAISLCDMVYNEMLTIVLLREHKDYEKTYADFNKKQKAAKAEKKAGGSENG